MKKIALLLPSLLPSLLSVTAAALLLVREAAAQTTVDRAYVGFTQARGTRIGNQGSQLDDRPEVEVRLPLPPLYRTPGLILLPSFDYATRWSGVEAQGPAAELSDGERSRTFHRFQLGLTLIRPLSPDWLVMGGFSTNTRTDFGQRFDPGADIAWSAFFFARRRIGGDPDVNVSFGLVGIYPYDLSPVIPIAGFSARKEHYIVEVSVPRLALLAKPTSGLELGITADYDRQVYRTWFASQQFAPGAEYVRETSLRAGITANVALGRDDVWLSSTVGIDFLNDYELLDGGRDRVADHPNTATGATPFVRLVLSWRPPRPAPPNAPTPPRPAPLERTPASRAPLSTASAANATRF